MYIIYISNQYEKTSKTTCSTDNFGWQIPASTRPLCPSATSPLATSGRRSHTAMHSVNLEHWRSESFYSHDEDWIINKIIINHYKQHYSVTYIHHKWIDISNAYCTIRIISSEIIMILNGNGLWDAKHDDEQDVDVIRNIRDEWWAIDDVTFWDIGILWYSGMITSWCKIINWNELSRV